MYRVRLDSFSGNQLRAARALIDTRQETIAFYSGVSVATIRRLEAFGTKLIAAKEGTLDTIRIALLERGSEITEDGVRIVPTRRELTKAKRSVK